MTEMRSMIEDSAVRLFADLVTQESLKAFDAGRASPLLWTACVDAGFDKALASEAHGGIGANPSDVFAILRAVGYYAAGVPLGDTMMANWLLSQAGIAPSEGHVCLMEPQ